MNLPEAIETSLRDTLRTFGSGTVDPAWIHCAQNGSVFENLRADESYPQILVAASGKYLESEGTTWAIDISVTPATHAVDDPAGETRADLYEEIERILDKLHEWASDQSVLEFFVGKVRESFPTFGFGGFTPEQATAALDGNILVFPYPGTIHFSLN